MITGQRMMSNPDIPRSVFDVFVYGSTPGGIAAAVTAARSGRRVCLACPKPFPGGMAASGLCTTDAVRRHLFGNLVLEFVGRIREHYRMNLGESHPEWPLCQEGWFYAPVVAQSCFEDMIAEEERLTYLPGQRLTQAIVQSGRIVAVRLDSLRDGQEHLCEAACFIDGTYEGDLAARAGVGYRVGREGREEYGEPLAGIHYMDWRTGRELSTPHSGQASAAIQAFCARIMLTDDSSRRIPIEKPGTYEAHLQDYLPLLQDFRSGRITSLQQILPLVRLPQGRIEANGHIEALTSLNCPGVSWEYPEADIALRNELDRFHHEHALGLLHFLQHDPHVPDAIRGQAGTLGLHKEEFTQTGNLPWQLYVRQGRRIEGRARVTQANFTPDPVSGRTPLIPDAIAMGEHSFDVHPCHDRRHANEGMMEGVLWYPRKESGPAQPGGIPYGSMLPRHIDNLLVPVALSATHIAMSVIRMEPVWMTLGQVAGQAAHAAMEQGVAPADLDPKTLVGTVMPCVPGVVPQHADR